MKRGHAFGGAQASKTDEKGQGDAERKDQPAPFDYLAKAFRSPAGRKGLQAIEYIPVEEEAESQDEEEYF